MCYIMCYFLHLNDMYLLIVVIHHGIEGRTAGAVGDGDGVHVEVNGDDAAPEAAGYLLGDVEDEGAVRAVVELHVDIQQMALAVVGPGGLTVATRTDGVGVESAQTEGDEAAAAPLQAISEMDFAP